MEQIRTLEQIDLKIDMEKVLMKFNPRLLMVISRRFGLFDHLEQSRRELAKELGISCKRLLSIERKALRILKHPSYYKILKQYSI